MGASEPCAFRIDSGIEEEPLAVKLVAITLLEELPRVACLSDVVDRRTEDRRVSIDCQVRPDGPQLPDEAPSSIGDETEMGRESRRCTAPRQ